MLMLSCGVQRKEREEAANRPAPSGGGSFVPPSRRGGSFAPPSARGRDEVRSWALHLVLVVSSYWSPVNNFTHCLSVMLAAVTELVMHGCLSFVA